MVEDPHTIPHIAVCCVVFKRAKRLSRRADGVIGRRASGVLLQVKPEAIAITASCGVVYNEVGWEGDPE